MAISCASAAGIDESAPDILFYASAAPAGMALVMALAGMYCLVRALFRRFCSN